MINEYKFRGKAMHGVHEGKNWKQGSLITRASASFIEQHFPCNNHGPTWQCFEVIPETVGICAEVFEQEFAVGDIVETSDGQLYEVIFRNGALCFDCQILADYLLEYHLTNLGNKWDNPELLAKLKEQEAAE